MRAEVHLFDSIDIWDLDVDRPPDPRSSLFQLHVTVGPVGTPDGDLFQLVVCSADRFSVSVGAQTAAVPAKNEMVFVDRAAWWSYCDMTGYLIVEHYDWPLIRDFIVASFEAIEGANWREVAEALSRVAGWEFESYNTPRPTRHPAWAKPIPSAFRLLGSPPPPEVHSARGN